MKNRGKKNIGVERRATVVTDYHTKSQTEINLWGKYEWTGNSKYWVSFGENKKQDNVVTGLDRCGAEGLRDPENLKLTVWGEFCSVIRCTLQLV